MKQVNISDPWYNGPIWRFGRPERGIPTTEAQRALFCVLRG
jgi:hypothetical protein